MLWHNHSTVDVKNKPGWHKGFLQYAIPAAASLVSSLFSKEGESGSQGGGMFTYPTFPNYYQRMWYPASLFYQQQLTNLREGRLPPYLQSYLDTQKQGLEEGAYEAAYGKPGVGRRYGAVPSAIEAGSITGVGPKASMAGAERERQNYFQKLLDIDRYISGLGYQGMMSMASSVPAAMAGMPMGPGAQVIPGQPYSNQNTMSALLPQLMGSIPWENMFKPKGSTDYGIDLNTGGVWGGIPQLTSRTNR